MRPGETEADALKRRLAFAYEEVFGPPNQRSDAQRTVLSDFERLGFAFFPIRTNAEDQNGAIDPTRLAINSGKHEFLMHVRENLAFAERLQKYNT